MLTNNNLPNGLIIAVVIILVIILAGCQTTKTTERSVESMTTVRVVTTPEKIDLPKITPPPKLTLENFEYNNPKDPSNVVGLDVDNYNILRKNYTTLKAREQKWRSRIDEANRLRECLLSNSQSVCISN